MSNRNKKVLAGLLALAVFVVSVFYLPRLFEESSPAVCFIDGDCQHETYLQEVIAYMPAILVLGFIFGITASYFYFERKIEIPVPSASKKDAVLSMLERDERKVIAKIVEKGGSALQSEVSRVEGIGKVKAHRLVDRLVRRGVIEKETSGKTNILKLKKELKDVLTK